MWMLLPVGYTFQINKAIIDSRLRPGAAIWRTYDTIRYDIVYLRALKSCQENQLNLAYGTKNEQVAQLSLTNPRDALHHDKRQNFKTVT